MPLFLIVLFSLLPLIFTLGKIVLEEFILEAETAHYIECGLSGSLCIAFYFVLLRYQFDPTICWLSSIGLSIFTFVGSWALPKLTQGVLGWGEEEQGVGPYFPLVVGWLVFLIYIPTGLGISLGFPNLFKNFTGVFFLAIVMEAVIVMLTIFSDYFFEENPATIAFDWFLHIIVALAILYLCFENTESRSYAWLLTSLVILAVNIEGAGIFYLAQIWLAIVELGSSFWKRRGYILGTQILFAFLAYIFPLLYKIFAAIERFIAKWI